MRIFIVGLLLLGLPGMCISASRTSSFQCPNGIVSVGDTKEEVASKCGDPSQREFTELTPIGRSEAYKERNTHTYESAWIYDPGPNGFVYRLKLNDGKVRYIENTEQYGSR